MKIKREREAPCCPVVLLFFLLRENRKEKRKEEKKKRKEKMRTNLGRLENHRKSLGILS